MKNYIPAGANPLPAIGQFTACIVDDEKIACNNLRRMLHRLSGNNILIQGTINDTAEAAPFIAANRPDVVFLDIEMPGENAFMFLERIHPFDFEVVFVTAY